MPMTETLANSSLAMTATASAASSAASSAAAASASVQQPGASTFRKMTPAQRQAAADRTARDFEASFITTMMESMMSGLKTSKVFGGGPGEEMYRSLLNQEYGKAIAQNGSLHIADKIRSEMLRLQETH